jgi:hypothetical protein
MSKKFKFSQKQRTIQLKDTTLIYNSLFSINQKCFDEFKKKQYDAVFSVDIDTLKGIKKTSDEIYNKLKEEAASFVGKKSIKEGSVSWLKEFVLNEETGKKKLIDGNESWDNGEFDKEFCIFAKNTYKPNVVDASGKNMLPVSVWGGTKANVAIQFNPSYVPATGVHLSMYLVGVQIIDLKNSTGGFKFDAVEDGYTQEEEEDSTTSELTEKDKDSFFGKSA